MYTFEVMKEIYTNDEHEKHGIFTTEARPSYTDQPNKKEKWSQTADWSSVN